MVNRLAVPKTYKLYIGGKFPRSESGRTYEVVTTKGEFLAIDTALAKLQPGDVCLILVDQVEEALAHIQQRVAEAA